MPSGRDAIRVGRFVFDPASGEVSDAESGRVEVRLQPQVAAFLGVLLERPGEVVSRAELRERLWPDTTVEFDEGLNYCVRQLRLGLGDEAGSPRFVETLPRRGYRLIAPVNAVSPSGKPAPPPGRQGRRRRIGTVAAVAIAAVAFAALYAGRARPETRHPVVSLAVRPFSFDASDSVMVTYQRRLVDQVNTDLRGTTEWRLVTDTSEATHVLSGALIRRDFSVEVFVQLVERPRRRHLWADSILDSYAFSGNSTLTADRIARSVARLLQPDSASGGQP